MSRRTEVFAFPGGLLEIEAEERPQGEATRYRPTALGYLRTDVSGTGQLWDESRIRQTAARLGFDLAGIVVYDPVTGRPPLARLKAQATRLDAEAVIVPELAHFEDGLVPESVLRRLEVITASPTQTHGV